MSVPSVPAMFHLITASGGTQSVTFAIPADTYTAAQWDYAGTMGGSPLLASASTTTTASTQTVNFPGFIVVGAASGSVAASAGQLTDINAAAGGNLAVDMVLSDSGTGDLSVTSFTLTLTGTVIATETVGCYRLTAFYGDPETITKTLAGTSVAGSIGPITGGYGTVRNGSKTHVSSSPRARI